MAIGNARTPRDPTRQENPPGDRIEAIEPGNAASETGIHPSDIITEVMLPGVPMEAGTLPEAPTGDMPIFNDAFSYSVLRNGKSISLPARLKESMLLAIGLRMDMSADTEALALRGSMFGF